MTSRIAYVCTDPGVPVFGNKGCSVHVQEVIAAFLRRGAHVTLFANRLGGDCPRSLREVDVRRLPRPGKSDTAMREQALLAGNAALDRSLRNAEPYDIVYERHALWSFAAMEYARETGTPGLLEVNAPLVEEQARWRGLVDRPGAELAVDRAISAASSVYCVSEELADTIRASMRRSGDIHVVANGVNPERFRDQAIDRQLARGRRPTIGFVGTLKPWHGVDRLIDAASYLTERNGVGACYKLLIVGDGPERANLERRVREATPQLGRVTRFVGAVRPDQIPAMLAKMDIAVAPYPSLPGFYFSPLKVFEYMAAGLAVVASRIGQNAKVIEHGKNGILTQPGDVDELADALEQLLFNAARRIQLGRMARLTILKNHTWDRQVEQILELANFASPLSTKIA